MKGEINMERDLGDLLMARNDLEADLSDLRYEMEDLKKIWDPLVVTCIDQEQFDRYDRVRHEIRCKETAIWCIDKVLCQ